MTFRSSYISRLKSALVDGGVEGRTALLRKAVSPVSRMVDDFLSPRHAVSDRPVPPCVLLCCPPRTGSTFIYQVLARVVPCAYVANVHQLAPRLGTKLLSLHDMKRPQPANLVSYYGHTRALADVSEGNEFVDYWFTDNEQGSIRKRFHETLAWIGASPERPAIIKNVSVYDRLSMLSEAVPELTFLRIVRDRQQSIESSLRAYRELGYINPTPDGLRITEDDPLRTIVEQVQLIEDRITRELSEVSGEHVVTWEYEKFCEDPEAMIGELCTRIGVTPIWNSDMVRFTKSTRKKVSTPESERIAALLEC